MITVTAPDTDLIADVVTRPSATRRSASAQASVTRRTRAGAGRRQSGPTGHLRLTRRGRVVVVLGLLVAVLALGFSLGHVSHAPAAESGGTRVLVVQPGDTLWSIAAAVEPSHDTRRVVAQLTAMNHLRGASVQVGERLTVPA